MAVQIGARPDSGFDDPIGMLKDCHRRIERFLHILCLVAVNARGRAITAEEASAVQSALHYFQQGGKRHTADEEESLFPRLRGLAPAEDAANLNRLESDHGVAQRLHDTIESLYSSWIESGTLSEPDAERLVSSTEQLAQLYQGHIQLEESIVFPHAATTLDPKALAAIGKEFAARRA